MRRDSAGEIHDAGHRSFVGGGGEAWNKIGELQFKFLVDRGLKPCDVLLDIACGALRGGVKFIPYLEPDHYLGMDKHIELILYGVAAEMGIDIFREKRPHFVISDSFEFEKFGAKPSFAIAQSLFTHLSAADLRLCLSKLRIVARPGCHFFATFFEAPEPHINPQVSHSHHYFAYSRLQMEDFGAETGWTARYIGDWSHPRAQQLIEYIPR